MATSTFPASTWKANSISGRLRRKYLQPRAFTLIELMVVLVIAAILAGIIGVRTAGYFRAAKASRLMDTLAEADRHARFLASTRGATEVRMLLNGSKIEVHNENVLQRAPANRTFAIPAGLELSLRTPRTRNATAVTFDRGFSPTYAIEVRQKQELHPMFWFVTLGSSGQSLKLQDASDVESLLALVQETTNGPAPAIR